MLLSFFLYCYFTLLTVLVLKSSCRKGALIFPGFGGGAGKAREQHPQWADVLAGNEVVFHGC